MVAHSIDPASDWKPAMERVCRYVYDARGKLTRIDGSEFQHWRFWCGAHVAAALHNCTSGTFRVTWLQVEGPRAEIWDGPGGRKALLASDAGGSVLLEADNVVQSVSYAAFGERAKRPSDSDLAEELAFNGELLDPVSRCYLLGAGHHRPYSTTLGIFLAPDCAAPFRAGGINSLAYCGGDPVNRIDPSGHVWKWILAAAAVVLTAAVVVATGGTGLAVLTGAVAFTKSTAVATLSTAAGFAGVAVESAALVAHGTGNDKAGDILGWVGLGLSLIGGAVAGPALLKATRKGAARMVDKATRFGRRITGARLADAGGVAAEGAGQRAASEASRHVRQRMFMATGRRGLVRPEEARLIGYHGTSQVNAQDLVTNGSRGIFVSDRVEDARHYANVRGGEQGVTLGIYADDVDGWVLANRPRVSASGRNYVYAHGRNLSARIVGADAPPVEDFLPFFRQRAASPDDLLVGLRYYMGESAFTAHMGRYL